MNEKEMVYAASYAVGKGYDIDQLSNCDLMYGKEEFTEDVWEYVIEIREGGAENFKASYPEYDFHWAM